MAKHRILWLKLGCTLVLAVGLIATGLGVGCMFKVTLLKMMFTPNVAYAPESTPRAPDYSQPAMWIAHPDYRDNADLVPPGVEGGDQQATAAVDTFYIHPTTYYNDAGWNQPLDDARANEMVEQVVVSYQASVFNGCSRVFVPRYRQATLGAYFVPVEQSRQAFAVAYDDVAAAFAHYIEHLNQGRPFIIAGHSQGSMHALRLLEQIHNTPLQKRLVAAYIIGYVVPLDKFERSFAAIPACASATDTGCVVSYNTFAIDAEGDAGPTRRQWYGDTLMPGKPGFAHALCTNPLTWTSDDRQAPASSHLGAVPPVLEGNQPGLTDLLFGEGAFGTEVTRLPAPLPGLVSARCHQGKLWVPHPAEETLAGNELDGSYHNIDYTLFYMDIRNNAQQRVKAFLSTPLQH